MRPWMRALLALAIAVPAAQAARMKAAPPPVSGAAVVPIAETGDPARGAALYAEVCAVCHGPRGQGGTGPSLTNLRARRDVASTVAWIKNPSPRMPKLYPSALSDQDVHDIASFVNGF
jgi:mono/diheme cytochrome c family protein